MREYELTVVTRADLEESVLNETLEFIKGLMAEAGATDEGTQTHVWGQRALAYPIEDHTSGYYVMYEVGLDPLKTTEMERTMSFREEILRHLLVRKEE
ncbi:MAG: 30S ribosomal protein S6 [Anaerolineales bacterium]|nr:30S ribosomal protein S6 [Anaerolineales bacterium]MCB0011814.1 30S ribosomal protein S6 [Anaerolineales bacterium]MCB0020410.1 30S ribosomal protein S6 [Anaerolineales bacterium]MCB0027326.1 30S ribosomal protein S6 [Anaerolineales bacterium]MCB8961242.1 30S ribosomal protein S6 [Ardenticatenales bacterium]